MKTITLNDDQIALVKKALRQRIRSREPSDIGWGNPGYAQWFRDFRDQHTEILSILKEGETDD